MNLFTVVLKRLTRIGKILWSINWITFFRLYHSDAQIIMWIPNTSLKYFGTDAFLWDMATLSSLVLERKAFKIVYGKGIGKYHNKKIFYTISHHYNVYKFDDSTTVLVYIAQQLELQGNTVFPKSKETIFWENKAHMHEAFDHAKVNIPRTKIYKSYEALLNSYLSYPFLVKAEHSCASEGVYKINSFKELHHLMQEEHFAAKNKNIIVQELINMRKDLRVILSKDEILLHYWRINPDKEWKPTSTSYGSQVDFDYFPEQWRQHILNTFKSLNLTTGAFDITWQNDDLSTEPIYLEVSPYYQPNPKMDTHGKSYAFYKQHFTPFHCWDVKYVDIVFEIKHKQVQAYLAN
jgi:glutathione synthase/RimK-type ligase-like ATP-grasp enzyme